MAKYISTDVINAAQWDPQETETMREFLAPLKAKIKKCSLTTTITPATLDQEGVLDVDAPSLVIEYSSGGTVTAKPTDYVLLYSATKLKVLSAANFEKQYQLSPEADPDETPATPAEKSALNELVTAASTAATTATVSEDGTDIAETDTWTTLEDVNALKVAIFNAHVTSHNPNATVTEVTDAIAVLTEAVDAFNASIKTGTGENVETPTKPEGPPVADTTVLTGAIAAATAAKIGATVSTDGSDVDPEDTWVTAEDVATLESAISAAQVVASSVDDQATVDEAVETLNAAVQAFKDAAKAGTKQDAVKADKTALDSLIKEAEAAIANVVVSEDGLDVEKTASWTTSQDKADFVSAINAAKAVYADEEATQDEVDGAVTALTGAKATFDSTAHAGLKTEVVNKDELTERLAVAVTMAEQAIVSTDGSDVESTEKWCTQSQLEDFNAAITLAQAIADKEDATQDEVNEAVNTLNSTMLAFDTSRAYGTKTTEPEEPTTVNKTALTTAIAAAESIVEDATVSEDGSDVDPSEQWVSQEVVDALEDVIEVTQAVVDDEDATQDEVDAAIETLNTAIATFGAAKQNGTKDDSVDKSALNLAIANALSAKQDVEVSSLNGTDIASDKQWVTQEAMDALDEVIVDAQATVDNDEASEDDVDIAITVVNDAIDTFNAAKKQGSYTGIDEGEVSVDD